MGMLISVLDPNIITIRKKRKEKTMNLLNASKMDYVQLSKEIDKTKKKISNLQETVRILEKLQIAEQARHNKQNAVEGKHQWK